MRRRSGKKIPDDKPIGRLNQVADFLPPPEKLLAPQDTVKVTIALDRKSLQFFRERAAKLRTKYQRMIREVVKGYAAHYS